MFLQAKNSRFFLFSLIAANALEYAKPIMEGVGEDMDISFMPWNEFPIKPDFI